MIQVCSQCGTRWNVRDRQRAWCPRCQGTLLAPSGSRRSAEWGPRQGQAPRAGPATRRPRLPSGYRWIAVRPGAARRHAAGAARDSVPRRATSVIPRVGSGGALRRPGRSRRRPRAGAVGHGGATDAGGDHGGARRRRVHPPGALRAADDQPHGAAQPRGSPARPPGAASRSACVAMFMVVASALRADELADRAASGGVRPPAAIRSRGRCGRCGRVAWSRSSTWRGHRCTSSSWPMPRAGCSWLRRPIVVWWVAWVVSTALSIFSIATSFTDRSPGHRRQHGDDDRGVPAGAGGAAAGAAGLPRFRAPARRAAVEALGGGRRRRQLIDGPESSRTRAVRLSPKGRTRQHSRL